MRAKGLYCTRRLVELCLLDFVAEAIPLSPFLLAPSLVLIHRQLPKGMFALGLLLFCVTLTLNFIALRVVQRYREQYD